MSRDVSIMSWLESPKKLFYFFGIFTLGSCLLAVGLDLLYLAFLPVTFLVAFLALTNYTMLYNLLFFLIPFSIEIYLPGGLGTDLPSEPLMLLNAFIFFLIILNNPFKLSARYFTHPISLLIYIHLGWTFLTAITSQNQLVSIKFFLAKMWYVVPFYFMLFLTCKEPAKFRILIKYLLAGLVGATTYVFLRHLMVGFSFAEVHYIVGPFFRNHVTYGSLICILLPFVWYAWKNPNGFRFKPYWFLLGLFLLLAMYLSYTRATYIAFLGAIAVYLVVRLKLVKIGLVVSIVTAGFLVVHLLENNTYLDYAPDYNKTITHTEFESLIDATAKGEDISTMERVYRWVAGINMIRDKFFLGFGPGNFYFFYKSYTEAAFKTYVSDNPDKSGIHSYYLMIFVEQGIIGFILFILLCIVALIRGQKIYHAAIDRESKLKIMSAILCLAQILMILIINDLIESDKVGPFFFFCLAILVLEDRNQTGHSSLSKSNIEA